MTTPTKTELIAGMQVTFSGREITITRRATGRSLIVYATGPTAAETGRILHRNRTLPSPLYCLSIGNLLSLWNALA